MEVVSGRRRELKERAISPERTKVWVEPKSRVTERKVQVVYYLTRTGNLEHPHFTEISIPSCEGLYLRDVIARLKLLRGEGMTSLYSWSSKRSYRNGFVWQDLTEDDFIYPSHGNEYILKGSEILHLDLPQDKLVEHPKFIRDDSDITYRKVRTARGSFDFNEYKNKMTAENLAIKEEEEEDEENTVTELKRNEISPPHSSSSSETLEEKAGNASNSSRRKIKNHPALMQFMSMVSHLKGRMPRAMTGKGAKGDNSFSAVEPQEEYFSGSITEKKGSESGGEFSSFRRSSSCNIDRGLKMELEEEINGVRARCIPKRLKAKATKKEIDANESKRFSDEPLQK